MRTVRTHSARPRGQGVPVVAGLRALLVAGVSLLAACGYFGGSHPARPAHPPPPRKVHAPPPDPAKKALAGMVAAVGPSHGKPPVDLEFAIVKRPAVGEEDEIDYALIPRAPGLGTVRLVFGSLNGLEVVSQGPPVAGLSPAPGVPIFGSVTVRPVKTGLYTLTAAVAVGSSARTVIWPFSIPVLVGEGPAQTAASEP